MTNDETIVALRQLAYLYLHDYVCAVERGDLYDHSSWVHDPEHWKASKSQVLLLLKKVGIDSVSFLRKVRQDAIGYSLEEVPDKYWVCWRDEEETGAVPEEFGFSWAEAEEMAEHFRAEDDGLEYFVGDENGQPVYPSRVEAMEILASDPPYAPAEQKVLAYYGVQQ